MAGMPGHMCPGVPAGNIATKSLVKQCFYSKLVLWAGRALPALTRLWLVVSETSLPSYRPTCVSLNNES